MEHIRPYQLFAMLGAPISERTARFTIPHRRAAGSLTSLETLVLVAAMRIVGAKHVFEFGTFLGATTLNLALNLPEGGTVTTLDLPACVEGQHDLDRELTGIHIRAPKLDFHGTPQEQQIRMLTKDSRIFDPEPYRSKMDFIFIDGGHDRATAEADTRSAFAMCSASGCVAWHDYGNADYSDLTAFLDAVPNCVHIEDTMICLVFFNLPRTQSAVTLTSNEYGDVIVSCQHCGEILGRVLGRRAALCRTGEWARHECAHQFTP